MTPGKMGEARRQSVALLRRNLTSNGILAASRTPAAEARRYTRVFGRDAAICALGMALSGEPDLLDGARAGLVALGRHQADNGQIPKYIDPENAETDFWYVGCIDATLWWLIAVEFLGSHGAPDLSEELAPRIERALAWLHCQEHPQLRLLQQNEASDWADIMPRSGFVLYTNALWYRVKRLYGLPGAEATRFHFNHLFFPFSRDRPDYRRLRLMTDYVLDGARRSDLYLSFVNFSFWGEEGDVFGNLLAVLFGLAAEGPAGRVLDALAAEPVDTPLPVRAICTPIAPDAPLWRPYMDRHGQNRPWQYHNGGAWPFIGGFWVAALAAHGHREAARDALDRLIAANARASWAFNEWFHGQTGEPMGMPGQSWNAAMLLLACHALQEPVF